MRHSTSWFILFKEESRLFILSRGQIFLFQQFMNDWLMMLFKNKKP